MTETSTTDAIKFHFDQSEQQRADAIFLLRISEFHPPPQSAVHNRFIFCMAVVTRCIDATGSATQLEG